MKVLICGMSSQTVIRSIGCQTTCGELKRQLGVSRLRSCGQMLRDEHTFFDNDVIHVLGRLRGGMEVNVDQIHQLPYEVTRNFLSYFTDKLCPCLRLSLPTLSLSLLFSLSSLVSNCSPCRCLSLPLYLVVFVPVCF